MKDMMHYSDFVHLLSWGALFTAFAFALPQVHMGKDSVVTYTTYYVIGLMLLLGSLLQLPHVVHALFGGVRTKSVRKVAMSWLSPVLLKPVLVLVMLGLGIYFLVRGSHDTPTDLATQFHAITSTATTFNTATSTYNASSDSGLQPLTEKAAGVAIVTTVPVNEVQIMAALTVASLSVFFLWDAVYYVFWH